MSAYFLQTPIFWNYAEMSRFLGDVEGNANAFLILRLVILQMFFLPFVFLNVMRQIYYMVLKTPWVEFKSRQVEVDIFKVNGKYAIYFIKVTALLAW